MRTKFDVKPRISTINRTCTRSFSPGHISELNNHLSRHLDVEICQTISHRTDMRRVKSIHVIMIKKSRLVVVSGYKGVLLFQKHSKSM